ncbi:hypothetical protein MKW94_024219 [Papaver nudicaule]|uniref:BHLH domain-containing protein n=1 Tax=Papaver nudicaule TaxID=74823 RepID=A0AA41S031_PAPNU|nr:hypothetical protein [Papaver nudicaule]
MQMRNCLTSSSSQSSLQELQSNQQQQQQQQIQNSNQMTCFDHPTSHDDFLDQMLSNLPSWSELKSPWELNTNSQNPKLFNIPIGGNKVDLSEENQTENNNSLHYPCDDSTVLASRLRQHHISGSSPKSIVNQHLLLSGGSGGGGMSRSPSTGSGMGGGDSVLFPLPLTLGSTGGGDSSDDTPFKPSNSGGGEGSVQALFNGIAGGIQRSGSQPHFHHPQSGSISTPSFGAQAAGMNQVAAGGSVSGGGVTAPARQKVRARRGQATDPHSIAERLRRERIAERMKALQELVPNANKTDKASMLDEIIDYVKFLQLQVKVLSMSRLGGASAVAPLAADISSEGDQGRNSGGAQNAASNDSLTVTEHQVAKLMEEDMGSAMQYLQGKGLCLMPISLATATAHSRNTISNNPLLASNVDGPMSPNLSALQRRNQDFMFGVAIFLQSDGISTKYNGGRRPPKIF